jgi:hypothetical protein
MSSSLLVSIPFAPPLNFFDSRARHVICFGRWDLSKSNTGSGKGELPHSFPLTGIPQRLKDELYAEL